MFSIITNQSFTSIIFITHCAVGNSAQAFNSIHDSLKDSNAASGTETSASQ
ncbi:hypothetical protein HOG21_05230 [bacterium]|nr:hypothetical protein [bacterium]